LLSQTAYAQPALFCFEYALFQLWHDWGIEPVAVMGHSVGEWVAACVADVVSLEEALRDAITASRKYAKRQVTWFRNQTPHAVQGDAVQLKQAIMEQLNTWK